MDFTKDELFLLLMTAADKRAHARRCAERCAKPNRPDSVKAEAVRWQREASLWDSIEKKLQ